MPQQSASKPVGSNGRRKPRRAAVKAGTPLGLEAKKIMDAGLTMAKSAAQIPPELKEQISDLADEFLYAEHGSWGDGDGATGTVVIDPIEGKIVNEHGWYFTDVNYETKEF